MADKSTRLIAEALTRAATEPAGLPLFAGKGGSGLFPATAAARAAAQRCQTDGLLRANGQNIAITDKGLHWLATQSSPRQVLEDFLRILEQKQAQTADLIAAARQMAAGLDALRRSVEELAGQCGVSRRAGTECGTNGHHANPQSDIVSLLNQWHATSSGDCPLPELYRLLGSKHPGLSIGRFHDLLRELHDAGRLYLHPWTGPLYDLPEPAFALLVGHLVAYYASPRISDCGLRIADSDINPQSAIRNPQSKEGS